MGRNQRTPFYTAGQEEMLDMRYIKEQFFAERR